jgi:Pin2-interacting protein X1
MTRSNNKQRARFGLWRRFLLFCANVCDVTLSPQLISDPHPRWPSKKCWPMLLVSFEQRKNKSRKSAVKPYINQSINQSINLPTNNTIIMVHHQNHDVIIPVGSKLRRQRGGMMRESVSAPVSSFARTQLERMGWTEGTGLGKKQDGITTHIKVKQRKEASGIGSEKVMAAVQQQQTQEKWWLDSLGSTLAKLGGGNAGNNNNNAQRHVTDEELFAATGGARFGMRAGKTRNLDKWKRVDDTTTRKTTTATATCTTSTTTAQRQASDEAAVNHLQQQPNPTKKKKKRKADENSKEDVENVNSDEKKSRKRLKKEKKPKKEKKLLKDKKREKRRMSP